MEIGGTSSKSANVERRRCEDRGAEGAKGVGCGEEVSPSPLKEGSGEGVVPSLQKISDGCSTLPRNITAYVKVEKTAISRNSPLRGLFFC